jgi:hypothetical protein
VGTFENVDLYDFVAGLLGLKVGKNDGDKKVLEGVRR